MEFQTVILGAGAAGLYCAALTGAGTLVIDHASAPAEKVRISGGGRCNFTNLRTTPAQFLSQNRHFAKSALARHGPETFVALVRAARIAYHEKALGQLFCDGSSRQIVDLLVARAEAAGATISLRTAVPEVSHDGSRFHLSLEVEGARQAVTAKHLVVATGGKSIPKMGATGLAYSLARQFGLRVTETRPALVPFTFDGAPFAPLSGVAHPVEARVGKTAFREAMLFTHRGLSGPAMLQISSYWREGEPIAIDLMPGQDAAGQLRAARAAHGKRALSTVLGQMVPARLPDLWPDLPLSAQMAGLPDRTLDEIARRLRGWDLRPTATEGYRTAEVTLGGVDTSDLSSQDMRAKTLPGLFFIGECVDVTGWLGGYNFQWAWASAHAAGTAIREAGA